MSLKIPSRIFFLKIKKEIQKPLQKKLTFAIIQKFSPRPMEQCIRLPNFLQTAWFMLFNNQFYANSPERTFGRLDIILPTIYLSLGKHRKFQVCFASHIYCFSKFFLIALCMYGQCLKLEMRIIESTKNVVLRKPVRSTQAVMDIIETIPFGKFEFSECSKEQFVYA